MKRVFAGSITRVSLAAGFLLALSACGGPPRAPAIGEAYVALPELKLRSDIPLDSPSVATVRHGERLEILRARRQVFFFVRTAGGAEGWADRRSLLGADDMANLQALTERAAAMPSQGMATTHADLRVHTLPSRGSPSFLLLTEKDKVDVLAHISAPRVEESRKPLLPPAPKKQAVAKKPKKAPKYPPPPMPKPPGPPPNWTELSKTDLSLLADDEAGEEDESLNKPPVPRDYWTLVRNPKGRAGWVLTSRLYMGIPDEVAQYAERQRIVSYFALGEVRDGDQVRKHWLWTTIGAGVQPYDFDSFRVFIWNLARHRYETAYIERKVKGYSPVLVKQVQYGGGKGLGAPGEYPGFSVCIEKDDGVRYRREYAFISNIVRFAGERPCEAPQPLMTAVGPTQAPVLAPAAATEQPSLGARLKKRLAEAKTRIFGK